MDFNNVNLWFAKDKNDEIITIDKINDDNKHDIYTCPICGSDVIARKGDIKIHHFAHRDKSKCSSETMIHWWVKHKLIEVGDKFSIKINKYDIKEFTCKDILIEKEYETEFGVYKPDITIATTTGETIYFEIDYTNKKKIEEYLDKWLYLNNIVVEVSVKDMINNNVKELKTIFYNGKCFNVNNSESSYHNTLGVYKQKIFNTEEVNKAKERLNKINWFWEECKKYRMKKSDEYTFFDVIDCLDIRDKEYVVDGLLKSNCTDVRRLYLYNKQKEISQFVKQFGEDNNLKLETHCYDELRYSQTFGKSFRVPYVKIEELDQTFYCDIFDKEDLIRRLNNYLIITTKSYEIIKETNSNIYKNYKIQKSYNTSGYDYLDLSIYYNDNIVSGVRIYNVKNSNIQNIVDNKINEYRLSLKLCGFESYILEYLKEYKEKVKELNKIRGREITLCVEECYEDKIKLYILRGSYEYNHILTIHENKMEIDGNIIEFSTFEDFKNKINKEIQNSIRSIRYNIKED